MSVGGYSLSRDQNKLEHRSLAGISSLIYCLMSVGAYGLASDQNRLETRSQSVIIYFLILIYLVLSIV